MAGAGNELLRYCGTVRVPLTSRGRLPGSDTVIPVLWGGVDSANPREAHQRGDGYRLHLRVWAGGFGSRLAETVCGQRGDSSRGKSDRNLPGGVPGHRGREDSVAANQRGVSRFGEALGNPYGAANILGRKVCLYSDVADGKL